MKLFNLLKFAPIASLAAASALSLGLAPAQALITTTGCANVNVSCTLAELFGDLSNPGNGGTIQIDDKIFDNWVLAVPTDSLIDYNQVVVTPLDDDPLNPGFRYDWDGQLTGSGVDVSAGTLFAFLVGTVDGSPRIKDNSLELLDYEVTGDGSVFVSEAPIDLATDNPFPDPNGDPLFKIVGANIDFDGNGTPEDVLFSDVEFPPQSAIRVMTAAMGQTDTTGGTFALRSFEQRFSQVQVNVPEGASGWSLLLGAGALGAGSAVSTFLKSKRKEGN